MYSVLCVDDEPLLLGITKVYLEKDGDLSVDTVESPEEAISILKDRPCDIVVRLPMPGMDGIEFLKDFAGRETTYLS